MSKGETRMQAFNNHELHNNMRDMASVVAKKKFAWVRVFGIPVFIRPITKIERSMATVLVEVLDQMSDSE
jgi:hypothetical protein